MITTSLQNRSFPPVPQVAGREPEADGEAPRRVLFVAACPFPCARGTPARILGQTSALARLGVDVHVATYHLSDAAPPAGVTLHRIPRVPTYRRLRPGPSPQKLLVLDPLLLMRTVGVVRGFRPDLIHGHHVEGGIAAIIAGTRLGIPVVFDAHTSVKRELPRYAPRPFARPLAAVGSRVELAVARRSSHVVTTTDHLRTHLLREAGGALREDAVTTIPTALDSLAFLDDARDPTRNGGNDHPRIIYTGSLAPFQDVDVLCGAFSHVRAQVPTAELLIVSSGENVEAASRAPVHPGIRYVHAQDLKDEFALLGTADVAVSPRSVTGGLPQKVLNYMRAGLPIVASEGSGDILRHGDTGWITPNGDMGAMSDALLHLLRHPDLRRTLGDNARRDALERFGWRRIAEDMLRVYRAARGSRVSVAAG